MEFLKEVQEIVNNKRFRLAIILLGVVVFIGSLVAGPVGYVFSVAVLGAMLAIKILRYVLNSF